MQIQVKSRITGKLTTVTLDYEYVTFHDAYHLSTNDGQSPQDFALGLSSRLRKPIERTAPMEVYEWIGKNILAKNGVWIPSSISGDEEYHPIK
jgi:hypothetical protein